MPGSVVLTELEPRHRSADRGQMPLQSEDWSVDDHVRHGPLPVPARSPGAKTVKDMPATARAEVKGEESQDCSEIQNLKNL